jgi:hypothetical protein
MEEMGEMIGKGFGVWRSNLNLCLPFLLSAVVTTLLALPFLAAFFMILLPLDSMDAAMLQNVEDMQEQLVQMQDSLAGLETENMLMLAALFLTLVVLLSLVNAFFAAGAIGMARQAMDEGKASTGAIWSYGRGHFWNLFLATLLIGLINLAGLIFLLPALIAAPLPMPADSQSMGGLVAGSLLLILYVLALSVILAAAPYALVLEGLGPVQAVLAAIKFFKYNKFDVIILWLVVAALSLSLEMISGAVSTGEAAAGQALSLATGMASLLIVAPLSNLWWTRLYMNRKGMLKVDEVKDPW